MTFALPHHQPPQGPRHDRFECGRQWALGLCGLLLLVGQVSAQPPGAIVLGGAKPTAAEVDKAKNVLIAAEDKEIIWNVGEFDLLVKGPNATGLLTWDVTDATILTLDEIPVDTALWINDVRAGQKERTLHKFVKQKDTYYVARAVKEGRTIIKVWANGEAGQPPRIIARLDVQVGKSPTPTPTPPGPIPPGPTPPGPLPIPDTGFRVLIVFESADLSSLPPSQLNAIYAREVREYLNAKCAKANGTPEWRMYDKDTNVTRESKIWQDAMNRPRSALPWILLSDGKTGYEGPLPANKDDLMKLLKQYGGQ